MDISRLSCSCVRALMIFKLLSFCFIATFRGCDAVGISIFQGDAKALVDWKNSLEDPSKALASWNLTASNGSTTALSCKAWKGITCNAEGRVLNITLPNLQLNGPLSPALGQLSALQNLNVQNSSLNGSLSAFPFDLLVGNLSSLDLSNNLFTGPLPPSIWSLQNLVFLHLNDNAGINGAIPDSISGLSMLQDLDLSRTTISGSLPDGFGKLSKLTSFVMRAARLSGPIPAALSTLTNLKSLALGANSLSGSIPDWLGQLINLEQLELNENNLTGSIPLALKTCTKMYILNLDKNNLSGPIPGELVESWSATLGAFQVGGNRLSGPLPAEFADCASLFQLDVGGNQLSGNIPSYLGDLFLFLPLALNNNNFTGSIPKELGQLAGAILYLQSNQLTGVIPEGLCSSGGDYGSIATLDASNNLLEGPLPTDINLCANLTELNLSNNSIQGSLPKLEALRDLQTLKLANNKFSGNIPSSIGSHSSLVLLDLANNHLTGIFPASASNLISLVTLSLSNNGLSGKLPTVISTKGNLTSLLLANNSFSGPIPDSLGKGLIALDLSDNGLSGSIPASLMRLAKLANVNVANNKLSGEIPAIPTDSHLVQLILSKNNLSGEIPANLTALSDMETLDISDNQLDGPLPVVWSMPKLITMNLSSNALSGSIPSDLAGLASLRQLDLSNNKLEGSIPSELSNIPLSTFNVSNNTLEGSIPSGGLSLFPNTSYSGNPGLCGTPLPVCTSSPSKKDDDSISTGAIVAIVISSVVVLAILFVIVLIFYCRQSGRVKKGGAPVPFYPEGLIIFNKSEVPFTMDDLSESTDGFSSAFRLGGGSFGDVYRAKLPHSDVEVAVKILSLGRQGEKEFRAEMDTLGKIRHRHLVTLLGVYTHPSSPDRYLIYNYFPGGSLDQQLADKSSRDPRFVMWGVRLRIAWGIVRGIQYLHKGCSPKIIHRDLKPGNILLDKEMDAYVADFGLARLWSDESGKTHVSTAAAGTPGYMAPEYVRRQHLTEGADIFSLGVILLQLVTGKKPSEKEVAMEGGLSKWTSARLEDGTGVDPTLQFAGSSPSEANLLMKLGLQCTARDASKRPSIDEVTHLLEQVDDPELANSDLSKAKLLSATPEEP